MIFAVGGRLVAVGEYIQFGKDLSRKPPVLIAHGNNPRLLLHLQKSRVLGIAFSDEYFHPAFSPCCCWCECTIKKKSNSIPPLSSYFLFLWLSFFLSSS